MPLLAWQALSASAAGRRLATASRLDHPVVSVPRLEVDPGLEDRLAIMRLRRQFGDDWTELVVTVPAATVPDVVGRHGGSWRTHGHGKDVLKAPPGRDKFTWALEISRDGDVADSSPNLLAFHPGCRQMSIDILQTGSWTDMPTQPSLIQVQATTDGLAAEGVRVAVVDSGVAGIVELDGRLEPMIDVLRPHFGEERPGGPASFNPTDPEAWDANGHGTAMASLVARLARGARVLPVRVVKDDCEGTVFDLAEGIRAAAEAGVQVISVSLSMPQRTQILADAVSDAQARGALVVAATGNAGIVEYPAAFPGVIAVTAVDASGWPPAFAPLGERVDLAAPGVDVVSRGPDAWLRLSGTSPATALVAAAAAAAVARDPGAGPASWRDAVLGSVRPADPSLGDRIGSGVLDFTPAP